MFNKQFGNASFGSNTFGTGAAFGQNAAANSFGPKPAATNAFGTTSTFGATPSTNLFGAPQTPAPTANAFGQSFGQPTQSAPQLGTGLFGTPNQTATASAPNVFGGTGTAFGARPQYAFASSGSSLFGNQAQASTSNNIFSQPLATNNSLFTSGFNANPSNTTGTPIKFTASIGSDSMIKNGATISINTRHHVINFMKEYENKSFEELRMEDYLANRKGPNASTISAPAPAQNIFSSPQQNTSGFAFGNAATPQKPLFGNTANTSFGAQGTGLFGAPNQPQTAAASTFNKPVSFGNPATSTNAFGFGSTNSAFNSGLQPKFGGAATTSVPSFGATNTFGTTPGFGAAANPFAQKPTAFGAPLTATTTATSAFNFSQPAQSSTGLFGAKPAGSAFATPALGGNTTSFTGFGAPQATSNLFGPKPNTFGNTFGNSFGTTNAFGSTVTSTPSMFNTTVNKPAPFSFNTPSTFNMNPSQNTFSLNATNPIATLGGTPTSQQICQNQIQQQLAVLNFSPFGDSPLFRNVIKSSNQSTPTDPNAQKNFRDLNNYDKMPHLKPNNSLIKIKPIPVKSKPSLFEGIKEEENLNYSQPFTPRLSSKKLNLNSSVNKSSINDSSLQVTTPKYVHKSPLLISSVHEDESEIQIIQTKEDLSPLSGGNKNNETFNDTIKDLNIKSPKNKSANNSNNSSLYTTFIAPEETEPLPQTSAPPHPTGIKLTRYGYYTVPTLDELAIKMDEEGNCFVNSFAIGRESYGNVVFTDRINVANLNLDEIVFFRRKEITLYPDEDNKPAFGQELNRKAQVTLDCVWPVDKSSREAIKDPERLKTLRYADKLEQATCKIGATFIEYRPETGSWVFSVKHFSKYGLPDDTDDDEIDPNLVLPKKPILPPPPIMSVSELGGTQIIPPPPPQLQILEVKNY